MILLRLLGLGAAYGFGFMLIKSLFPEPFILLLLQGDQASSEGNLTVLALVYMGAGLVSGLIAAPILGGVLLLRRRLRGPEEAAVPSAASRLGLSLALAVLMGVISGVLTLAAYATGILQSGGVLDPLRLIGSSIHREPGVPLLVAWAIARDLLPAGLAGLFLSPLGGAALQRLYAGERPPAQRRYDEFENV